MGGSVQLQCMFVTIQETTSLTIQWDFVSSSSLTPQQVQTVHAGTQMRALPTALMCSNVAAVTKSVLFTKMLNVAVLTLLSENHIIKTIQSSVAKILS